MTRDVYVTGCGAYLPGEPIANDDLPAFLGEDDTPVARAVRRRVLAANGIRTRHYALGRDGRTTMLNEELAAEAVQRALQDGGGDLGDLGLLATGTTQGDVLVPGFASMVHGRLGAPNLETLSAGGVCASGMAAFKAAVSSVRMGEHDLAAVVGSELVSRSLRAARYVQPASGPHSIEAREALDAQFLRWTLSDGAGAVLLQPSPRPDRPCLRVDWTYLLSHAGEHGTCMRAGMHGVGTPEAGGTWLDHPTATEAERVGLLRLRQDVRVLPDLVLAGTREFMGLVRRGRFRPAEVDHVLCHFSAEHFRADIFRLLREADLMIDEDRWFTNLHTRGNTGAASIFVMLEEAWREGRFAPGERILLLVPESGRFSFAFAHLTCVAPDGFLAPAPIRAAVPTVGSPLGAPRHDDDEVTAWTLLELADVWAGLERRLARIPILRRIEHGGVTLADYRRLLLTLRPQVVEGGRWIARAASNFSIELFELRSAAIGHAGEEHRDFHILEEDFCSVGGELAEIQQAEKNAGSEALSAFMFHQAGKPDPVDLLGAMFVIEGLGTARALRWAEQLQEQLGLADDQIRFLRYHGANDDDHFEQLRTVLRSGIVDRSRAERIVRTARIVARLYALQLEEIDA